MTIYLDGAVDTTAIAQFDSYVDRYLDGTGAATRIFNGSYDWHSSIHAHLANIIAYESAGDLDGLTRFVTDRYTTYNVQSEIYSNTNDPYGWAWLLHLDSRLHDNGFDQMKPAAEYFGDRLLSDVRYQINLGTAQKGLGSYGDVNWKLASLAQWATDRGNSALTAEVKELFSAAQSQISITASTPISSGDFYSTVAMSAYAHVVVGDTDSASYAAAHDAMLAAATNGALTTLIAQTSAAFEAGTGLDHFAGRVLSSAFGFWALFEETKSPVFYNAYKQVMAFSSTYASEMGASVGPGHWLPNFATFAAGLPDIMKVADPDSTIAQAIEDWTPPDAGGDTDIPGVILNGDIFSNVLSGGAGDDTLDGQGGSDTLNGGAGDDVLKAGYGFDTYNGGTGVDTYQINGTAVDWVGYTIDLTQGRDQYGNRYSGIENIIGGAGNDVLTGDSSDNRFTGMGGNDTLRGGGGEDTAVFTKSFASYSISVQNGYILVSGEGRDQIYQDIEMLAFADKTVSYDELVNPAPVDPAPVDPGPVDPTPVDPSPVDPEPVDPAPVDPAPTTPGQVLIGDSRDNTLTGGAGNDTLDGKGGRDLLSGGAGDDVLLAGYDNGTGDVFDGGAGQDTYMIDGSDVDQFAFKVDLASGSDQYGNQLRNIEHVTGGQANDELIGNALDNLLAGKGGNDTIRGGAGEDSAVFTGQFSDFQITQGNGYVTVSGEGVDRVYNDVEHLVFDDQTLTYEQVLVLG